MALRRKADNTMCLSALEMELVKTKTGHATIKHPSVISPSLITAVSDLLHSMEVESFPGAHRHRRSWRLPLRSATHPARKASR